MREERVENEIFNNLRQKTERMKKLSEGLWLMLMEDNFEDILFLFLSKSVISESLTSQSLAQLLIYIPSK
jgi:hypothetical protein